jgi:hypothetical protein
MRWNDVFESDNERKQLIKELRTEWLELGQDLKRQTVSEGPGAILHRRTVLGNLITAIRDNGELSVNGQHDMPWPQGLTDLSPTLAAIVKRISRR